MALDSRISLLGQQPKVSQAINIFENALMNNQTRDIRQQQADQQALLNPLQVQLQQQGVEQGQQALNQNRQQQRLVNVHQTGQRLKPFLESGDIQGAQQFLLDNISSIQSRIEQGSNEDVTESMEALSKLQSGDTQGLLGDINAVAGLVGGRQQTGTASQRDFQTFQELNLKAQESGDPADILAAKQFGIQSGFGRPSAAQVQEQAISKAQQLADIEVGKSAKIETKKSELSSALTAKKLAVTKSGVAFDKLANIDVALSNFDDAIKAIDEGAQTGTIISSLPSFRKSSIELDNIQKALGLDVVSNTTFGALSESELKFALDKALPKNLQPQDLKTWLQAKKSAQLKLRDHISKAATFLGTGENTIPDWIELQKAQAIIQQAPQQQVTEDQAPVADSQLQEGQTATGPNGEKAIFTNGQWVVQ